MIAHKQLWVFILTFTIMLTSFSIVKANNENIPPTEDIGENVVSENENIQEKDAILCEIVVPGTRLTVTITGQNHVSEGMSTNLACGQSVMWSSSDTSVATVNAMGLVTGVHAGTAVIQATYIDYSTGTSYSGSFTFYVTIPDGVYNIRNKASYFYVSVLNWEVAGTTSIQSSLPSSMPTKLGSMWKVKYLDQGCYSIRPMFKLSYCLEPNTVSSGQNVKIISRGTNDTYGSLNNKAKWTIENTGSGYVFKAKNNASLCLQIKDNSTGVLKTSYFCTEREHYE